MQEHWGSKLGVILAVSGSAIGLGNFVRFPSVAVQNGGGAFMIPYFIALMLIGIPLAWAEWTLGRWGGMRDLHSGPSIFHAASKKLGWKFAGVLSVFNPLLVCFYYIIIESWCLAYFWFAISGRLFQSSDAEWFGTLFGSLVEPGSSEVAGAVGGWVFPIGFFIVTFALNYGIILLGIRRGIEKLTYVAMPVLAIFAVILMIRVFSLGFGNDPGVGLEATLNEGLGFLWNPDFKALLDGKVWLAAAGQIFFSLSLGLGAVTCYSSYVNDNDDVALSSLTANSTNTFAEVILGASIIVPTAVMFFGVQGAQEAAQASSLGMSFVVMPNIFTQMTGSGFFAALWFGLLFLAAVTSSVSILQPVVAFLEDEFRMSHRMAVSCIAVVNFLASMVAVRFVSRGAVDELDYWAVSFGAIASAFLVILAFNVALGNEKGFQELNRAASIEVPEVFKYILFYVTPALLVIIFVAYLSTGGMDVIRMKELADGTPITAYNRPVVVAVRASLAAILAGLLILIWCGRRDYLDEDEG